MVKDLSIVESTLVEAWVAGPLFGANFVLYFVVASILMNLQRNPHTTVAARNLLVVTTLQLAIATAHIATLLAKIVHAFVQLGDAPGEAQAYLADFTSPLHTAEQALYTVNDIIASGVLTWRCYVVCERNWRPCVPMILACIGTAVTGIGSIAVLSSRPHGFNTFFNSPLCEWLVAFWVSSVLTQVGATALIAHKIWAAIAWRARATHSTEWAILRIFVESGALYSGGTVVVLVMYLCRTAAGTIVAGMLGQLSTLAPYLMIVRAEVHRTKRELDYISPRTGISSEPESPLSRHSRRMSRIRGLRKESIAMAELKQISSPSRSSQEVVLPPGW